MPKISVIIPLYNKEKTIKTTIESVLNQTFTDFEIIVVNDGSTDRSLEIVKRIDDSRIRIIDKDNEGVSITRNRGAHESSTDLLFFLDADDIIMRDCLSVLYSLSITYPKANLWTGCFKSSLQGKEHDDVPYKVIGYIDNPAKLLWKRLWGFRIGSYLISKKSFLEIGGFPEHITIGEDMWFTLNYLPKHLCAHTDKMVMCYVKDCRTLSKTKVDIYKICSMHATFDSEDKYVNRKFASLVGTDALRFLIKGNIIDCKSLLNKYGARVPYILFWTLVYNVDKFIVRRFV